MVLFTDVLWRQRGRLGKRPRADRAGGELRARDAETPRGWPEHLSGDRATADRQAMRTGGTHRRGGPASARRAAGKTSSWRVHIRTGLSPHPAHSLGALMGVRARSITVFLSLGLRRPAIRARRILSPVRARLIAAAATVPVYALGGLTARNAARLPPSFQPGLRVSSLLRPHCNKHRPFSPFARSA
ncbi:MAG: hypothetical protein H6924_12295 [Alphaproteobacteria bacterium]|nr:hypothetical protein [Alphaproteobacteria bacterium]